MKFFNYLLWYVLQAIVSILRKESSVIDTGTFTSNAVITGNLNATKDVESENYNKIREFFTTETDAFLVSAAMNYFGMESVNDSPKRNVFSSNLNQGSMEEKRRWLCEHAATLFDQYVSDSVTELGDAQQVSSDQCEQAVLPCRFSRCTRVFKYAKCRINHEKSKHGLLLNDAVQPRTITQNTSQESDEILVSTQTTPPESDVTRLYPERTPADSDEVATHSECTGLQTSDIKREDCIFNYGCLHISLGLLIRDAEDSVKEGDGQRLVRVWKFLTLLFRLRGCHKYALAGIRLIASTEGLLTPRKAHQLIWNRFAGLKHGPGTRISRDERLEQLNKVSKEEIRSRGFPNINDDSVVTATRSTGTIDKLVRQSNTDLQREAKSGHHCNSKQKSTFTTILTQVHCKAKVFMVCPGREYKAFPGLRRDIFKDLCLGPLAKWLRQKKQQWHRQNRHMYKFL